MMGLFTVGDEVIWEGVYARHDGKITGISDDGCWVAVTENDAYETTWELPVSQLKLLGE